MLDNDREIIVGGNDRKGIRGLISHITLLATLLASLSAGAGDGSIGPSLPDLGLLHSISKPEYLAVIFSARAIGNIIGSLLLGHLFDFFDPMIIMALCGALAAIFFGAAPWLSSVVAMITVIGSSLIFHSGVMTGIYFIASNVWVSNSAPYIHSIRLVYHVGLTIAPLMLEPFLADDDVTDNLYFDPEFYMSKRQNLPSSVTGNITLDSKPDTKIQIAYLVIASLYMLPVMFFISIIGRTPISKPHGSTVPCYNNRRRSMLMLILDKFDLFLALVSSMLYGGMELAFMGLLMTYVTKYLGWTKNNGVFINFTYQGIKFITGSMTIIMSKYVPTWLLVITDVLFLVIAQIMHIVSPNSSIVTWISTVIMSLGMANLHPSNIIWTSEHITFTGKISAYFAVAVCLGHLIIPVISGLVLSKYGVNAFPAVLLVPGMLLCIITCYRHSYTHADVSPKVEDSS